MKILFIVPGSGDPFYCGNCFRDNLHANALRRAGHDVIVLPLYLPLTHQSFEGNTPLFFPATTFYVAQKFFDKRHHMPRWLERALNSPALLRLAASFSGSTSANGMEGITLAMINGSGEAFHSQVLPLVEWVQKHEQPDVIHLSSTLVVGVAKAIKQRLNIPIVCSLQDEELWVDTMPKPFADAAWQGIASGLKYVDRFVASSHFYKNKAQKKLPQIAEVDVIYPGIKVEQYAANMEPQVPTIGFFYRMCEANGLHILAQAFALLKSRNTVPGLRLKLGGGYTAVDKKYLRGVKKILAPHMSHVSWSDDYNLSQHADFYKDISVVCVPITFDEGAGLYLCEAFAAGRPAVEPAAGSFPEIVDNAGLTYSPNSSDALADALARLLTDAPLYARSRARAFALSQTRYSSRVAAERLGAMYGGMVGNRVQVAS